MIYASIGLFLTARENNPRGEDYNGHVNWPSLTATLKVYTRWRGT